MAWEWSHTDQAYANAEENLKDLGTDDLQVIYAEWKAMNQDGDFEPQVYKQHLKEAEDIADDILAGYIWERSSEQRTCTNGGHMAWVCPWGCHLVSFDQED